MWSEQEQAAVGPARPPRQAGWAAARVLAVVAMVGLAAFRFSGLQARPLAVGACTNPYTVQPGDWIYKIAAACGVSAPDLIAANGLADPNQIQPGQQLALPLPAGDAAAQPPAPESAAESAPAVAPAAVVEQPVVVDSAPAAAPAASPETMVVETSADTYVDAQHPNQAEGGSIILRTEAGEQVSYLAFEVNPPAGAVVTGASLRVYVHGSSPDGFAVHATDAGWDEWSLTHSAAPGLGGQVAASGGHGGGRWVEVDLGGHVGGPGRYSLALVAVGPKSVAYSSRQMGGSAPQLVVRFGGGPAPQPTVAPPQPTEVPPQPTEVPPQPTDVPPQPTVAPPQPTAVPPQPTQPPATGNPLACDVTNLAWSREGQLLRGGRPNAGAVVCLAAAGVDVLVDQRAPGEVDYDIAAAAAAAGMEYLNLGIPDDSAPSPATVRAWIDTVNARLAEGKVVLVHDRAGRGRMGFWDAVFAMTRGASAQQAIEDRYIARAYSFNGAKIGCGDGGNGQVQALAEIGQVLTGSAYTPSADEYGTRWANCARPGYMDGWDYGSLR